MKKKLMKIFSILIKLILIITIIFAVCNVVYRKNEEMKFKEEMENLINRNLTTDNFDTQVKTDGTYGDVEHIIKVYLNDYASKVKEVLKIVNDEKIKTFLSPENYIADGPLFVNTIEYLTTTKETFNREMEELIELTKEESILKNINDKKYSTYFKDLYSKYMLGEEFKAELEKSITELKLSSENINTLIDKESAVITFLASCKDWTMKDNRIVFYKQDDLTTYNTLIEEVSGE